MPQVIVRVNDRPYTMMCDEGEQEHLTELAAFLDDEVASLKKTFGQVGDSRLLLMAGLVVADKLSEALRKIEDLQEQVEGVNEARSADQQRGRSLEDSVADKLDAASERLETLAGRLKASSK